MTQLNVFCRGALAGRLTKRTRGDYRFEYTTEYLTAPHCPPISVTLPKQSAPFESPVLFPFFFGLLAEGEDCVLQCRVLKIDERDAFTRLMKTCAVETIGGVTVREVPGS